MSKDFIVEVSARHVHLSQEAVEILFGKGATLTKDRDLSQPGEFACIERVDVVGPKNTLKNVAILGPARAASQVEISVTDGFSIGVPAMVRGSGDVAGTNGVILRSEQGEVTLQEGVIAAMRHIHATPQSAQELGIEDQQIVKVAIDTQGRSLIFGDVLVRVSPKFALAMHIDTDEANAASIGRAGVQGYIVE